MSQNIIVVDPTTGHVDPHSIAWQHEENILGLFHPIITIEDKDIVAVEERVDASPSIHPIELFVGDVAVFAHYKQWEDVAKASGQIIIEGAKLEIPEVAAAIIEAVALIEVIKTKNIPAIETAVVSLSGELFKLIPEFALIITKKV